MCGERTGNDNSTRILIKYFVDRKARHAGGSQVNGFGGKYQPKFYCSLAITYHSFELLLKFKCYRFKSVLDGLDILGTFLRGDSELGDSLGYTCLNNTV